MDELMQLLPALGAALSAAGAGLAYVCKRIDVHMERKAQADQIERDAFRDYLIKRDERSAQQLDEALETQTLTKDAIREHTAAVSRMTGALETNNRRLEEAVQEIRTVLQRIQT